MSSVSADFPGYQAGASLKLLAAPTPGAEAGDFPGYQAGASLKLADARAGQGHRIDFPGYQAGASLKPAQINGIVAPSGAVLPRLPSRGLIEATSTSWHAW